MKLGLVLLRATIGGLYIGHGTQKLFGWWGGEGPEGTGRGFEQLGIVPGKPNAIAAGTSEAGGGALLALGFLTPLAGASLAGVMATAVRKVHFANGPWIVNGGWEYNAVLAAAVFALVDTGPGELSLDHVVFGRERWGPLFAAGALAAGVAGSAVTIKIGAINAAKKAESAPAGGETPAADASAG